MSNYLTIMDSKKTLYDKMVWEFNDLLDFYNINVKYEKAEEGYWKYFRKNWNVFIDKYPRSLLIKIIPNQNIEHL